MRYPGSGLLRNPCMRVSHNKQTGKKGIMEDNLDVGNFNMRLFDIWQFTQVAGIRMDYPLPPWGCVLSALHLH